MINVKQALMGAILGELYHIKKIKGEGYVSDAKKRLFEIIQEMDTDKINILLDYACDLANLRIDKCDSKEQSGSGNKRQNAQNIIANNNKNTSKSPMELVEFECDSRGIILLEHEERETGEKFDDQKEIKLSALIKNDTSEPMIVAVDINFYDDEDVNVGSSFEKSPKIKPGKSWKMINETWVNIFTKKYDLVLERREW